MRERSRNLSHSLVWFAGSYGLAIIGYLAVNAIAARALGAALFGDFMIASTAALVAGQFALLGVHRSGLREAARVHDSQDPVLGELREDVRTVERTVLLVSSAATGLVSSSFISQSTASFWWLALATAALVYASAEQQLAANYLRGFGAPRLSGLMEGRSGGALVALVQALDLIVLTLLVPDPTLPMVVGALAAGYAVPTLFARWRVSTHWRHMPRPRSSMLSRLRDIVQRNWRFVAASVTTSVNQSVEIWIAGALLASHEASLFSASLRLALQLSLAAMIIQVTFSPVVSRLWSTQDLARLQSLLRTGASLGSVGLIVGWLPMLVFPSQLMKILYGPGFADHPGLLVLLTIGSAVTVATGLCGTVLVMTGHEGIPATLTGITLVGRTVTGGLAAYYFGVWGLTVSSVLWTSFLQLSMTVMAQTRLRLNTLPTLRPRPSLLRGVQG